MADSTSKTEQHDVTSPVDHSTSNDLEVNDTQNNATRKEVQRWNSPRINIVRILAAIFSFIVLGMNDAAYGALLPYLEVYYDIGYTVVAIIFLTPFVGYMLAALLTSAIHHRYGQLGIAVIAPLAKIVAYVVICVHPPYPVLPVMYIFAGLGNGLEDGAWNAWIGVMDNANEVLGILHAAYGLGALLSPLIATSMITRAALPWYTFYYVMIGAAALEWASCIFAFWTADAKAYKDSDIETDTATTEDSSNRLREALLSPITWLTALYLFIETGVEVGVSGWVVSFMLTVRNGSDFASGLTSTGYWLGMTVGRLVLGFITGRIGEKLAVFIYLILCVAFELCFWLIPSFISSAIFVAWLGFFLGPLFPATVIVATYLLPRRLHVTAISIAAAAGSGGGAVLPFVIGAIAQAKGVEILQPFILALIVLVLILWAFLTIGFKKSRETRTIPASESIKT